MNSLFKKAKQCISKHKYKILACVSLAGFCYYLHLYLNDQKNIQLSVFLQVLKKNQLSEIQIEQQTLKGDNFATIYFKSELSNWYHTYVGNEIFKNVSQQILQTPQLALSYIKPILSSEAKDNLFHFGLTLLAIYLQITWFMNNKIQKHNQETQKSELKLNDYYGGQQIKQKLMQCVDFIKNSMKYQKLGARLNRGILLYGPPGTGKTFMAKIIANQAQLGFLFVAASQLQQMYVGVGAKRIKQVFKQAKSYKKGCIIFIDQIDSIGRKLNQSTKHLSAHENHMLNQLLVQMDSFKQNKNIIVIAATNRIKNVDPALLRSGRFDIKFKVNLPNEQTKFGILKAILQRKKISNKLQQKDLKQLVQKMKNWCGADIEALINQAIFKAIRHERDFIIIQDLQDSLSLILPLQQ